MVGLFQLIVVEPLLTWCPSKVITEYIQQPWNLPRLGNLSPAISLNIPSPVHLSTQSFNNHQFQTLVVQVYPGIGASYHDVCYHSRCQRGSKQLPKLSRVYIHTCDWRLAFLPCSQRLCTPSYWSLPDTAGRFHSGPHKYCFIVDGFSSYFTSSMQTQTQLIQLHLNQLFLVMTVQSNALDIYLRVLFPG